MNKIIIVALFFIGISSISFGEKTAKTYNDSAMAMIEIEDYSAAIKYFTKVIEIDPRYADAYYNRGGCKAQVNNHHGAIDDFDKAIALKEGDPDAYYNRGLSKYQLGIWRGALADFSKTMQIAPEYYEVYIDIGYCKYELGEQDEACSYIKKAAFFGHTTPQEVRDVICGSGEGH